MWFKAKVYGFGWYPCSWQGWFITAIFVIALILTVNSMMNLMTKTIVTILLVAALISICVIKGEKARWRKVRRRRRYRV